MTGEEQKERDHKVLDSVLAGLSEHFDNVQIIATRSDGTDTLVIDRGTGNWYARYGAVREWIIIQEERTKIHTRQEEG